MPTPPHPQQRKPKKKKNKEKIFWIRCSKMVHTVTLTFQWTFSYESDLSFVHVEIVYGYMIIHIYNIPIPFIMVTYLLIHNMHGSSEEGRRSGLPTPLKNKNRSNLHTYNSRKRHRTFHPPPHHHPPGYFLLDLCMEDHTFIHSI